MNLENFHTVQQPAVNVPTTGASGPVIRISRAQASRFAKSVAGDFNPIHNVDASRFCVPGDLLFALLLKHCGLAKQTEITFEDMVTDTTELLIPEIDPPEDSADTGRHCTFRDTSGSHYLQASFSEAPIHNEALISTLTERYVQFSGHTFPDILVELMQRYDVMINPARPLVIYRNMSISLQHAPDRLSMSSGDLRLEFTGSELTLNGKKGEAMLRFRLTLDDTPIGVGSKLMLLAGLRAYEQSAIDAVIERYGAAREAHLAGGQGNGPS